MPSKIIANGITIHYALEGPASAPVVLFSNSLMANYRMWDLQTAVLRSRYRVLRYDQRGHGKTEVPPGPYSIDVLARDAVALLDALGIQEKVHFVGLSLGGFTGQRVGLDYGDRLKSLVLCDTAAHMPPPSLWDERIHLARSQGMTALEPGSIDRWFTKDFQQSHAAAIEPIREGIRATPVEGFIGSCEAIKAMDHRELLSRIRTPTLVMVGEQDPATPVSAARILHNAIATSEFFLINDAAHLANVQQPEIFNRALVSFLERHSDA